MKMAPEQHCKKPLQSPTSDRRGQHFKKYIDDDELPLTSQIEQRTTSATTYIPDDQYFKEEKKIDLPSSERFCEGNVCDSESSTTRLMESEQPYAGNVDLHKHELAQHVLKRNNGDNVMDVLMSPQTAYHQSSPSKSWTDYHTPRRRSSYSRDESRTKSPESFSSPSYNNRMKQLNNNNIHAGKKKYGYGDLFQSSSSRGSTTAAGLRSRSFRVGRNNVYANDTEAPAYNSRGMSDSRITPMNKQQRPSFTKSDFPLLSPDSKPSKQKIELPVRSQETHERQASWSAMVGVSGKDITDTETSYATTSYCRNDYMIHEIPHPPLYGHPKIPGDEEVKTVVIGGDQQSASSSIQSSKTYWQQVQRQRSHSFHHCSSSSDRIIQQKQQKSHPSDDSYQVFSSFTTMSIAALQNDIGSLLARSNRVEEAIKRYKLSIVLARSALDSLNDDHESIEEEQNPVSNKKNRAKCPKVTEAEGLAWFRQKLLRGDVVPAHAPTDDETTSQEHVLGSSSLDSHSNTIELPPPPFQPAGFGGCVSSRRLRSASFSVADICPASPKRQPLMPRIEQTRTVDDTPLSPLRPSKLSRNISCPISAPHPGKMLANFQPRSTSQLSPRNRSSSFYHRRASHHAYHHTTIPSDDIVHDLHQHQKLDCPDEVYSCNGLTPLGLEYICDPLPILGSYLRRSLTLNTEHGVGKYKRNNMSIIESVALIAARLNLASLEYRLSGGGVNDKLQAVLEILELVLVDCQNAKHCSSEKITALFCYLKAVVYANIGTLQYRLKKTRDAMASFEHAKANLEKGTDCGHPLDFDRGTARQSIEHDDNRLPPQQYLLLIVRLNISRVSLVLNKPNEASEICKLIAEDNKPHRRVSSLRSLMGGSSYQYGSFRRSNSFSVVPAALDTAMAAYEHDIDRRSKWLSSVAEHYITGLIHEANGEVSDYKEAWHHYNRLLSLARVKLDHRHVYICSLLERRGKVLFEQRNLGGSMLSYLACLKILEHQQLTGSRTFNEADLARVLYAVARVLHDNEEYHDAIHMYQRALVCQRNLASLSGRPSLDIITTLCNICRVYHLSGEVDASLVANREVLDLAIILVGGKTDHPFLINRLKVEGNILVEAGRLEDAMNTFVEAARRCPSSMMGLLSSGGEEDANAGDSSVLSIRSAAALALINIFHPGAATA